MVMRNIDAERRAFLGFSAVTAGGLVMAGHVVLAQTKTTTAPNKSPAHPADKPPGTPPDKPPEKPAEEEVAPNEDLMREHGLLNRVLLIYEEVIRRIDAKRDLNPNSLLQSAKIIRNFVEDYHEKLEEDHLFP